MEESLLEIRSYEGPGYQPLIDFNDWRVAILRYLDELQPERIDSMERHCETDEVFVLLQGRGTLLLGGNGATLDGVQPQAMEPGKLYNVKRNAWHGVLLSQDASVLLVENRNTARENSEYAQLTADQRQVILEIAKREGYE
ncbi:MAG: cupin domain-containing protein [Chloroflexi bacterium]|nr:cupin domain-containing protein [Chloroflexota bacterium]